MILIPFAISLISLYSGQIQSVLGDIVKFEMDVVRKIEKGLPRDATKRELAESRKGTVPCILLLQTQKVCKSYGVFALSENESDTENDK